PILVGERLLAARRCTRQVSCRFAICGTELCDGSGYLACGRRLLPPPARAAPAPMTSPCPGSSGSDRRACAEATRLRQARRRVPPKASRDVRRAHLSYKV